jgi:integrase
MGLYRPKIVEYTLPDGDHRTPDGKRVTSNTPDAVRTERRSKTWYGRYTDGNGKLQRVPLSESKETARRMFNKLRGDAELTSVGIVDPFAEHRRRPLTEHVADFGRYLAAKGNTADHVQKTVARCTAIVEGCKFTSTDDLQPSAVVEFLGRLREGNGRPELPAGMEQFAAVEVAALLEMRADSVWRMVKRGQLACRGVEGKRRRFLRADLEEYLAGRRAPGIVTSNHYLTAIKEFSRWLARDRRAGADPLFHLSRQNAEVDLRHQRRALKEDLFSRFIEATATGAPFRGIGGPDRLVLYTLGANTGFRASELGSLKPESFALDATPTTVTVEAAYSKHRREDVQPLRADVAALMRSYLAGREKGKPVWPGTWTKVAAEMLRGDLAAAGIPYRDDAGRYFDFHALRGQFISLMAAKGVHPKVAQVLARHSTITLTMDYYTHLDVLDVAGALDKLPGVASPRPNDREITGDKRRLA